MSTVPDIRVRAANDAPIRADGRWVVYWMTAFRRTGWNFALQRARDHAVDLGKPLVILEALRVGYRWASDRLHAFVLDGMRDNAASLRAMPATYHAYVEDRPGAGAGLLERLARDAAVVVGDDYPAFFLPRMVAAAARRLPVRLELVDANGLLPLRAADRVYPTAHGFRRFLQRTLPDHVTALPEAAPLTGADLPRLRLPADVTDRWPDAADALPDPSALPIDHSVGRAPFGGGSGAAAAALASFVAGRLDRYASGRNHPDDDASSGLSPYLHFGHLASHEIFAAVAEHDGWHPGKLGEKAHGKRRGWWGMSESAEAFLDELVTWRELGFNMSWQRDDYHRYESLPEWARQTLADHADDPRPHVYSLQELERGLTHDRLWNAAQGQLVSEGRMHNYLRMLWGKKVLEWSESPHRALEVLTELNNKYAVDGRDPNSYSGILWIFGRYDRAWGPERGIYGKVRYMSSDNTRKKLQVKRYEETYAEAAR